MCQIGRVFVESIAGFFEVNRHVEFLSLANDGHDNLLPDVLAFECLGG
jgi:hypothetical protein